MFSAVVTQHWIPELADPATERGIRVVIDSSLEANRSVSLLKVSQGPDVLALTPERASELSLSSSGWVAAERLAASLAAARLTLNDPDYLFYLPVEEQATLRGESVFAGTRQLTMDDQQAFARFAGEAPEDDFNEAFVELDHWLVFGTFIDGQLATAASMYPWAGTRLADLGVITLPAYQGRGLGRATVRAISAHALGQGYQPQYRCQLDNTASVALARSAGFAHFGQWEVLLSEG